MKTKVLLACPMMDGQSGTYLHNSLIELNQSVAYFDWRHLIEKVGVKKMNSEFLYAIEKLKPDITIIIKGTGITAETIKKAREIHNHNIVGWIFDVTLGGTMVKDVSHYVNFIKELDTFYTIDNDAIPELKELGVNAEWLSEGYHKNSHKEEIINFMQKKKYGNDLVFLGSVGGIHKNREKFLKRLHDEGFNFSIYGNVLFPVNEEPLWVKDHHTGYAAINEYHSMVCQASKIVIGIDGWPDRSKSYSARLYRTMCPGGFYLTTHTKDIEQEFIPGKHLDTFKTEDEMVEKVLKYLENDDLREKIAEEGQKLVIDKHNFTDRLKIILSKTKVLNSSKDPYIIKDAKL